MNRKNRTEPVKRNLSSTQVLKTLLLMMKGNYTMEELIEGLNQNEKEPVFNNSVVSKYINTCRFCGIEIPKIHNRYIVACTPFGINLTDREYELLQYMQEKAKELLSARLNKKVSEFMIKLSKHFNREIIRIAEDTIDMVETAFINAAGEDRKIRLMFKANDDMDCYPSAITEKNGKKYLKVFCAGKEKQVSFDKISGIEILHEKYKVPEYNEEVVFKLTGGLASRYELRAHEKIMESNLPEYIVVSNKGEEWNTLISRLLRYDSLCEVMRPHAFREAMRKTIEEMLSNYGEN